MTFSLRQYQIEAVQSAVEFLLGGSNKNGLLILPCGSGKSLVLANIAQRLDAPVLIFNPGKEILEQNLEKFRSYGYSPGVYSASMNRRSVGEITLATIGSVKSRAQLFEDFPYVIVDEAHYVSAKGGMYKTFFDSIPARLLGLTATPFRMATNSYGTELRWLTRTKPKVFQDVVYYAQLSDLFAEGYLAKLEYQIVRGFNKNRLKVNSTGAEYTDESVQRHLFEIGFDQKLEKVVRRLIEVGRGSILVFTRFVQEAERLATALGGAVVTAKTPKAEREAILADFKRGAIKVCANVGVLATGFDYPELDTVVLARPTMSLSVYYQQVGRGIRPHPSKESCWVVDMVDLSSQFGRVEELTIHEDPWRICTGIKPLTNTYLTDRGNNKCSRCGHVIFWARHETTNKANPLCRPPKEIPANIELVPAGGKTVYRVVPPGSGEFISHYSNCPNAREFRR
jgi:DNA repair protein RadD